MFRKVINYMLVILIALQSVAAFADVHQYIQTDTDHLSADGHKHRHLNVASQTADSMELNSTQNECDHCCHCHASAGPFLNKVQTNLNFPNRISDCPDYLFSMISFQEFPDNPPPIL